MVEEFYLVDTCSYLRLAPHLHPLLNKRIENTNIILTIYPDIEDEYKYQSRLKNKFSWFNDDIYKINRKPPLKLSRNQKILIVDKYPFYEMASSELNPPMPSPVDIKCLICADIIDSIKAVITDDRNMYFLAQEFEINVITSLEFLKILLDSKVLTFNKIKDIVNRWNDINDLPIDFYKYYKLLYNENPPFK